MIGGAAGSALSFALERLAGGAHPRLYLDAADQGQFLGIVPFRDENARKDVPLGHELDGRLYTDLSRLSWRDGIVETKPFYLRTRASERTGIRDKSGIDVVDLTGESERLKVETLRAAMEPMGAHLMECAGNSRAASFGLMGVASWAGVPLSAIICRLRKDSRSAAVQVSGFDWYEKGSATSTPGASWIFAYDEIERTQPFLALEMNGAPLVRDHGAPVRLVVPGWYGCASIKWVNSISCVSEEAEATSQMREFASRTSQNGVPILAREYAPPSIEVAALPIRVEKWKRHGRVTYCVIGILWGGAGSTRRLEIRFNPDQPYRAVDLLDETKPAAWTFWWHKWCPPTPGQFAIQLRIGDSKTPTRRLDRGVYVRNLEIAEV